MSIPVEEIITNEARFCEALMADRGGDPLALDYWQRAFIVDDAPTIAVIKSRQCGFSFAEAAKGLARSHIRPWYEKYFVSLSLEESKRKIQYVQQLYDSMPERMKLRKINDAKTEIAFEDSRGRVSRLRSAGQRERPQRPTSGP